MSGTVTSVFKGDTGGFGDWSNPSVGTGGGWNLTFFSYYFFIILKWFPSEALTSTSSISSL